MAGQTPDFVEAITDDEQHRKTPWSPGEKELVERQTAALEEIAHILKRIEDKLPGGEEEEGGGEPQPKAK